jgi:glycerol-3-phosphate dehydrogenase
VWVDALREMDGAAHSAAGGRGVKPVVAPSQGVHLVVDREFLESDSALMVPKTSDGRVLFAVPWLGKVILGTTDTPRNDLAREPQAFAEEVEFILRESARYLRRAPTRQDVKSIWVGLRPLVKPQDEDGEGTKGISREHTVIVSRSGLVTVTGGKWTTYRAMAEDVLRKCAEKKLLPARPAGQTVDLRLVGAQFGAEFGAEFVPVSVSKAEGGHSYGSEKSVVAALPGADVVLSGGLTEAMVRFAARHEYAVTVEDMLARRCRMLFLDARKALELAPRVAHILQEETGLDAKLPDFGQLAQQYLRIP